MIMLGASVALSQDIGFLLPGVNVVDSQKNGGRADLSRLERSVGDGEIVAHVVCCCFC